MEPTFRLHEREFSMALWTMQLVVVYCGPTLLLALIENALGEPAAPIEEAVVGFSGVALIAFLAALAMDRLSPGSAREGVWVWLLPTCLLAAGVLFDALSMPNELAGFFYAPRGDPDPTPVLLTVPTWGCCWYSAATYWRRRRRRHVATQ